MQCFRKHEREKIRAYGQRVREVEHATFVPIVMSATGGLSKQATNFYKRLASLLADKWDQPYSTTLHWLRCSLSFSLLRSAIQCIYTWRTIIKGARNEAITSGPGYSRGQFATELTNLTTHMYTLFYIHCSLFLLLSYTCSIYLLPPQRYLFT